MHVVLYGMVAILHCTVEGRVWGKGRAGAGEGVDFIHTSSLRYSSSEVT